MVIVDESLSWFDVSGLNIESKPQMTIDTIPAMQMTIPAFIFGFSSTSSAVVFIVSSVSSFKR